MAKFLAKNIAIATIALWGAEPEYRTIPAARLEELSPANPASLTYASADWPRSYGDHSSSRYSKLTEINRTNVSRLQVAWTYHSGDGKANVQTNPVIVEGIIYAPTAGQYVVAIDGATGKEIWRFKPGGRPAHRGLIHWKGDEKQGSRLYFTAGDWIYALDARTGRPVTTFGKDGRTPGRGVVAPSIYNDLLIVPCWNVIRAFDLLTGAPKWTFHSVPRKGQFGYDTWSGPGHGANTWGGMALDPARGIVFFSTGSPHPNYLGMLHSGDNLFANSLVALKAETGERLWHMQEIHHDIWDLDIPAPPNLVTVTRNGRKYDAVAQVTKIGNTLLLDRVTGKPIFPMRYRRAPKSMLEGETTAEWQPDLELPEPFGRQNFSFDDVTDITPESRKFILDKIAGADYGWFQPFRDGVPLVFYGMHGGAEWTGAAFDPGSGFLYVTANKLPWVVNVARTKLPPRRSGLAMTTGHKTYLQYCSGCHGPDRGGGAGPPLFGAVIRSKAEQIPNVIRNGRGAMPPIPVPAAQIDALTDFIFERDLPAGTQFNDTEEQHLYKFAGYSKLLDEKERPGVKPPWGTLNAINLNTGRIAWRVPLGEYEDLTAQGIPKTGTENFGGAMVTAGGLVFAGGTRDLKFRAFDSETGKELWEHRMQFGPFAPPATYQAGGRQFVIIAATGGGKVGGTTGDAWVAFALPRE